MSGIVVFDNNDIPSSLKKTLDTERQRVDLSKVNEGNIFSSGFFKRLSYRAKRRSPSNQNCFRFLGTEANRRKRISNKSFKFFHSLVHHRDTRIEAFGEMSILGMFITIGNNKSLAPARHAAWRNTVLRILVATIVLPCFNNVSNFRKYRECFARHGRHRIKKILIRKEKYRRLPLFRHIESVLRNFDRLFVIPRCKYRARKFPVPRVEREFEITLLGPRRESGRGTRTLCQMNHDRKLHHTGERNALAHQRKPAAGRRHQCSRSGKGRAESHIDRRNFVFRLLDGDAEPFGFFGEKLKNARRRRHRVGRDEIASARDRPHRYRLGSIKHHLFLNFRVSRKPYLDILGIGEVLTDFVSLPPRLDISFDCFFSLRRKTLFHKRFESGKIRAKYPQDHSRRDGILKKRISQFRRNR